MFKGAGRRLGSANESVDEGAHAVVSVDDSPDATVKIFVRVPQLQMPLQVDVTDALHKVSIVQFKRLFLTRFNAAMSEKCLAEGKAPWALRSQCRLIFKGQQLSDGATLADVGFEDGDHCHAMVSEGTASSSESLPARPSRAAAGMSRVLGFTPDDIAALRAHLVSDVQAMRRSAQQQQEQQPRPQPSETADERPQARPTAMRLAEAGNEPTAVIMRPGTTADEMLGLLLGYFLGFSALPLMPVMLGTSVRFAVALVGGIFCNFLMSLFGVISYDVPIVK